MIPFMDVNSLWNIPKRPAEEEKREENTFKMPSEIEEQDGLTDSEEETKNAN